MFTFKSPFFSRTQGLNSRINTTGWMSSSKFRHTKYWAIIFCSVSPSKNYPWHGLYVHQLQLCFYIENTALCSNQNVWRRTTGSSRSPDINYCHKPNHKEPWRNNFIKITRLAVNRDKPSIIWTLKSCLSNTMTPPLNFWRHFRPTLLSSDLIKDGG